MKNKINDYFRNSTPVRSDDEVLFRVLRKAEEMQKTETKRKIILKKPALAVCAAAAALTLFVTGAAAAGIINFNEIFDKRITVENEELGEKLLCNADNFTFSVSDDAYQIEIQGLAGTDKEILGSLIVSRKDGTPVTDYIENVSQDEKIFIENTFCEMYPTEKYEDYKLYCSEIFNYHATGNGDLKIEFSIYSIYNMYNSRIRIGAERKYMQLPFDWSVEFVYTPSETAVERLYRGYFTVDDKVPVVYCVPDEELQNQCEPVETMGDISFIELSSINGKIEGTAKLSDEWIYKAAGREAIAINKFDVYLTKKDGTKVCAFVESGGYAKNRFDLNLIYISDEVDTLIENETLSESKIAVDLSEIKSITINGKTYDMQK